MITLDVLNHLPCLIVNGGELSMNPNGEAVDLYSYNAESVLEQIHQRHEDLI